MKNLSGGYKIYQLAVQKQANEDICEYDKTIKDDKVNVKKIYFQNVQQNDAKGSKKLSLSKMNLGGKFHGGFWFVY